jgi:DUF4097 and DUF4098 domain-containing protein YvlB
MRRLPILALTLAAGLATTACDIQAGNGKFDIDFAAGKATETWSKTYKIADKGRLELINVNGRITAEATDGADVVVEGRKTAKARSDEAAKELLTRLEIREEVSDSNVRVESRPPRLSGLSSHEIEWTVKVPKGIVVDLRTTNGGVRLSNLANEIHAKSTNGGVRGEKITASIIEATTVNGGVEIELSAPIDADDSVELEAVNGGVSLALPSDSKATIEARCVNGGVRVENLDIKRDQQSSEFERRRRVNGTLNGGGAKVRMSTTNGGVELLGRSPKKTT